MRAVLQRVTEASVTVEGEVVGRIDRPGLCVLVGVTHSDDEAVAQRLAVKIYELRVLRDERSAARDRTDRRSLDTSSRWPAARGPHPGDARGSKRRCR